MRHRVLEADGWGFLREAMAMLRSAEDHEEARSTAGGLMVQAFASYCFVDLVRLEGGYGVVDRLAVSEGSTGGRASELRYCYTHGAGARLGTGRVVITGESDRESELDEGDEGLLRQIAPGEEDFETVSGLVPLTYICVPLWAGSRTIGTMGLITSCEGGAYSDKELSLTKTLADCMCLVMDKAFVHRRPPQGEREEAFLETVGHENLLATTNGAAAFAAENADIPKPGGLENLQLRILESIAHGLSDKKIAEELHISIDTVRYHTKNIKAGLGATSRAQAVKVACDLGCL